MEEKLKMEITKGAEVLSMSQDDAMAKYSELCEQNGIEETNPVGLGLWRNFVANSKKTNNSSSEGQKENDSFYKAAFGFFVTLEAPRDMMSWNRSRAKEEFMRDEDNALEKGIVAVATENALGKFTVSRYHNGEYREAVKSTLPDGAETLEDGRIYIPLDNTATYMNGGVNENYGTPLPKEQYRRSGVFYGTLDGKEMRSYYFSYKNQAGVDFAPNTFEWVHFLCVEGSNGTDIYGAKELTLSSLKLNSEIDKESDIHRDMSTFNFEDCLRDNFSSHLSPLVGLDRAHVERQALPSKERYIITDGTVVNMVMTPTKNGNRIIILTDLNTSASYDDDAITTFWIPSHLKLDFGIGSSVIVCGRTSQRVVDGNAEPVTVNASGIYCVERQGSVVEVSQEVEENFDWF